MAINSILHEVVEQELPEKKSFPLEFSGVQPANTEKVAIGDEVKAVSVVPRSEKNIAFPGSSTVVGSAEADCPTPPETAENPQFIGAYLVDMDGHSIISIPTEQTALLVVKTKNMANKGFTFSFRFHEYLGLPEILSGPTNKPPANFVKPDHQVVFPIEKDLLHVKFKLVPSILIDSRSARVTSPVLDPTVRRPRLRFVYKKQIGDAQPTYHDMGLFDVKHNQKYKEGSSLKHAQFEEKVTAQVWNAIANDPKNKPTIDKAQPGAISKADEEFDAAYDKHWDSVAKTLKFTGDNKTLEAKVAQKAAELARPLLFEVRSAAGRRDLIISEMKAMNAAPPPANPAELPSHMSAIAERNRILSEYESARTTFESSYKKMDGESPGIIWYEKDGTLTTPLVTPFAFAGNGETPPAVGSRYVCPDKAIKATLTQMSPRCYLNPLRMACLLGAIADGDGFDDIAFNGSTKEDGTGYESREHINGDRFDLRFINKNTPTKRVHLGYASMNTSAGGYKTSPKNPKYKTAHDGNQADLHLEKQKTFISAMVRYGFTDFYSWPYDTLILDAAVKAKYDTLKPGLDLAMVEHKSAREDFERCKLWLVACDKIDKMALSGSKIKDTDPSVKQLESFFAGLSALLVPYNLLRNKENMNLLHESMVQLKGEIEKDKLAKDAAYTDKTNQLIVKRKEIAAVIGAPSAKDALKFYDQKGLSGLKTDPRADPVPHLATKEENGAGDIVGWQLLPNCKMLKDHFDHLHTDVIGFTALHTF